MDAVQALESQEHHEHSMLTPEGVVYSWNIVMFSHVASTTAKNKIRPFPLLWP